MRHILTTLSALALAACATGAPDAGQAPAGPPRFVEAPGQPASANVKLYADCIAQAAAAGTYDREAGLIRFRCEGAPAKAFYDGLAAHAAATGSQYDAEGRTWRATQKIARDLSGADVCWEKAGAAPAWGCTLVFNAGTFATK